MSKELKHRELNTAWWGSLPEEQDGGSVVLFYQMKKMAEMYPRWNYYGIPKVPEELSTQALPFMKYMIPQDIRRDIPLLLQQEKIPLITTFHIAEGVESVMDDIHLVGSKIVQWQTVHWATDRIFTCKRLNELDWFVAPTEFAKRLLINQGGVDHKKITVIPHGVDLTKFYPRKQTSFRLNNGIRDNQKVILYTGRLSTWKGVHNLIPIMRKLINKYDCVFIIRGGYFGEGIGKRLHKIFTLMSERTPNIIFISDWISHSMMEEIVASADIMLFPSSHEGFGCPVIEGMAKGIPVVTTDIDNIREILGLDAGILLKPKDQVGICDDVTPLKVPSSQDIYDALSYLLENPEECELMGEAGVKRATEKFDLEKVCNDWATLINELVPATYDMDKVSADRLLIQ